MHGSGAALCACALTLLSTGQALLAWVHTEPACTEAWQLAALAAVQLAACARASAHAWQRAHRLCLIALHGLSSREPGHAGTDPGLCGPMCALACGECVLQVKARRTITGTCFCLGPFGTVYTLSPLHRCYHLCTDATT